MTSKIVNVTAHIVARDIAETLAESPKYPYQIVFSVPYYQQLLLARVLSGVRNQYIVVRQNSNQDSHEDMLDTLRYSLQEYNVIHRLIQESLIQILEEDINWKAQVQIPDNAPVVYPVRGHGREPF